MRIALIRGPNLNPWELGNFDFGEEVVPFGSRRGSFEGAHGLPLEARRLWGPSDALGSLPGLAQALIYRLVGNYEYLFGLERALEGFDIAHSAELITQYSLQAVRAREAGRVKRVVATVWENIMLPAHENAVVARRAARVAGGLDGAIAISERARLGLELAGVPGERIETIPMGVDVEHFATGESRVDGPLRVLSVARLVPEKGVEDLVVALRLLGDRGVDARLTLVGTGPLGPRLHSMADRLGVADRLDMPGTIPYERLPSVYGDADVFVLASAPRTTWREQFGFAVVEAMACGLPVLAGHSGSLDEVVGDADQLVTPHDPVELADALEGLAREPALRAARGAANRERALERYDRREVAQRIKRFYERVLASPARS
ncbi:MAG: alpha-maltose-phosphate synthase [Thermoleophilaceae bacterium]|nr:alpha-maltose-phosphate synthase [Thermoleophilaceae bacterium]